MLAAGGHPDIAFDLYVSERFIHHNPFFRGDRQSLLQALKEARQQTPNKFFEILRALEDGNLVAVHSHVQQSGNQGFEGVVVHIFRFEENKITELWDLGQSLPDKIVNVNGVF